MAEGVVLALGTRVFYGLADWVYKRAAASGVQPHHFLALQAPDDTACRTSPPSVSTNAANSMSAGARGTRICCLKKALLA